MLILEKVHEGFETNWRVGSGSEKECIPDPHHCLPGRSAKFTKLEQDYTLERNCWSFFSSFCCLRLRITASGLEMLRVKLVSGSSENRYNNKNKHLWLKWCRTGNGQLWKIDIIIISICHWNGAVLVWAALKTRHNNKNKHPSLKWCRAGSVADPWHFGVDPDPDLDPRILASD